MTDTETHSLGFLMEKQQHPESSACLLYIAEQEAGFKVYNRAGRLGLWYIIDWGGLLGRQVYLILVGATSRL